MTRYELWQHKTSGERWAVRLAPDNEEINGVVGPLYYTDVRAWREDPDIEYEPPTLELIEMLVLEDVAWMIEEKEVPDGSVQWPEPDQ